MCGAGEVLAGHFGEDAGAGPHADAGHRCQDLVNRVGLHEGFDLGGDVVTLAAQGQQLFCIFSLALACPRPAVFRALGVGYRVSRSATAGWSRCGPRARSRAG